MGFLGRSVGRAMLHRWLSFRTEPRWCTDAFGPDSWFGAMNGCTDVALLAALLNIVSYLEPVVPLPYLIQGFVNTEVTS
jgi:hypothetical protein